MGRKPEGYEALPAAARQAAYRERKAKRLKATEEWADLAVTMATALSQMAGEEISIGVPSFDGAPLKFFSECVDAVRAERDLRMHGTRKTVHRKQSNVTSPKRARKAPKA